MQFARHLGTKTGELNAQWFFFVWMENQKHNHENIVKEKYNTKNKMNIY